MPPSAPPRPASFPPPDWYSLLAVAALFLLPVTRLPFAPGELPLFSLGEWLLLPLAGLSLSMGILPERPGGRTLLPFWLDALLPGILWLAAASAALLLSGTTEGAADLLLAWVVRLFCPTLVFLPLLVVRVWRDRLLWALAAALAVNAVLVFLQTRTAGLPPGDIGLLELGGAGGGQFAYGVLVAVALPLLAAWRGGDERAVAAGRNRALFTMLFTFLLPALALSASFTAMALAAAAAGLSLAWAVWRRSAWITGVFVCLLVFGAGGGARRQTEETARRQLFAASAEIDRAAYSRAATAFERNPYRGEGAPAFAGEGGAAAPWYASLLAGTGAAGLGMWLVLLAELAARGLGRSGAREGVSGGGVLGAVAALAVCGVWADVMAAGAGGLVGLLLAASAATFTSTSPAVSSTVSGSAPSATSDPSS